MNEPVTAEQTQRDDWRHLLTMLIVFAVAFLVQPDPAPAQVQAYSYSGPAYSYSDCGGTTPPCLANGHVSASIIFQSAPATGTGGTVLAWSMTGTGIGTLSTGDFLSESFDFTNGQITTWNMAGVLLPSDQIAILTASGPGDYDEAAFQLSITGPEGLRRIPPAGHWTGGQSLGSPCNPYHSGAGSCGEPIDLGSGNMFYQATDYETAGQNKLSLIRYYNSLAMRNDYAASMGGNWRTNYDRYLHILSTSAVAAERPDGQTVGFYLNGSGIWTPDSDVDLTLTKSGSTWTLTDQNDTSEIYFTSGSEGVLQSIKLRNGFTEALTYSHGQIAYVSDSYTRKLTFGYSSGLLSTVSTPEFTSGLTYSYVTYDSGGRLASVTYNTSPTTNQTYLYENADYPFALTGITDENGNRYATWGYDGTGRATLSELSGAVNYTSVYYNDANGNRVVKGPLGIVETYKFASLQGVPKVTEIDRAANSPWSPPRKPSPTIQTATAAA